MYIYHLEPEMKALAEEELQACSAEIEQQELEVS